MSTEPLVSIVTPFFNTEKYLAECIESVISQTYQTWEYLLVDNCSTDGSLAVATQYQRTDGRIKVIRNEKFLSQVENYNRALEKISPASKYCKVVQADDMIFPNCIAEMVKVAERSGTVGLVGSYYLKGTSVEGTGAPFPTPIIPGREACRKHLLEGRYLFGSPTSVMYLSATVRQRKPFYAYGSYLEDTEICYDLLKEHDFGFVYQVLSYTRTDNCSISSVLSDYNPSLLNKYILISKYGEDFLSEEESRECLRAIESKYFTFLGSKMIQGRGEDFWSYHRNGVAYVGGDLTFAKILLHTSRTAVTNLCNLRKILGYFTS